MLTDSVAIRRLRSDGSSLNALGRARKYSFSANHGGVAIIAATSVRVRLTPVDTGHQPTTFEYVAARMLSGSSSYVAVVVYQPARLDGRYCRVHLSTCGRTGLPGAVDPIVLAGDVYSRLGLNA